MDTIMSFISNENKVVTYCQAMTKHAIVDFVQLFRL